MQIDNFVDGLATIRTGYNEPDGYVLGAEHDIIYVYATDKPLFTEDVEKLFALGWFQPDVDTGDEAPKAEQYDPAEGWGAYV